MKERDKEWEEGLGRKLAPNAVTTHLKDPGAESKGQLGQNQNPEVPGQTTGSFRYA